ncbi:MAG: Rrf2 family transcriptional regulator [Deltaproteobacteria bacterium]|nr:Rrf2 family transcriptional regulator [Deltaproteobacteria bacterium]
MLITKKNQYALRAIFELAKHNGKGPQKISEIAQAQAIPVKFLEVILNQLKGSGLVDAKRGFYGGYFLVRHPDAITVGDIMRFMERNLEQSQCVALVPEINCPFKGDCAFFPMWNKVKDAMYKVYDETTIQDLIDSQKQTSSCS